MTKPAPPSVTGGGPEKGGLVLCIPVYNDWDSLRVLLQRLAEAFAEQGRRPDVVLIDDGSRVAPDLPRSGGEGLGVIHVVTLTRNLGHQRAIAVGLCHILEELHHDTIVVMDADGEDRPEDVLRLLERFEAESGRLAIFAARRRRTETVSFRLGYLAYRTLHRLLTGKSIRVGNFSVISRRHLQALVTLPELWSHYAASFFISRLPFDLLPIDRGHRIAGRAQMRLIDLIVHGLAAISVYSEIVGVRLLLASVFGIGGLTVLMVLSVFIRGFTSLAVPGWATVAVGLTGLAMLVLAVSSIAFGFLSLQRRVGAPVTPLGRYRPLILSVTRR